MVKPNIAFVGENGFRKGVRHGFLFCMSLPLDFCFGFFMPFTSSFFLICSLSY